ncbi:MAG: preprotein translocase subunit YajC [Rhodospirillaceae bacterium]|jgi:preprotein translocase subunit YajC|nr:preprotein translocase subunit YajC [Rhodospirillaceae bacterium]MBT5374885.1 preprotein translocase subunit YajC [Rhodospirillaceae bacterium]MBT5660099.1 preprotein translocase subunit YajC [Rhodospirillaceae bacterium]MBT5751942.1 preprotein translocase subunit YajC [Rhodospirillaceae bacterium]
MIISPAFAQSAAGPAPFDPFGFFMPLLLVIAVFYFLVIRPQQKKMKEHNAALSSIRRGDTIVTGGGLIGKVAKVVDETELLIDLGKDNQVRVIRSTISSVLSKPDPADEKKSKPANDTDDKDDDKGEAKAKTGRKRGKAKK